MLDFITVNTQSSIRIQDDKVLYFDPFKITDTPHDADIILITHSHFDHWSPEDIRKVMKPDTILVCPQSLTEAKSLGLSFQTVVPNESYSVSGVNFRTIPAYNLTKPFHPKNEGWVGYLLHSPTKGDIYIAGDTDMTAENQKVRCQIAFLPIGGTYTMNAVEAAELADIIQPEYVIPIHSGSIVGKPNDAVKFTKVLTENIKTVHKLTF